MSQIVFKIPGKDEPGFLRRAKRSLEFKQELDKGVNAKLIDEMVEFLLPYITEPTDRQEARDSLLDATEAQFYDLIDKFSSSENPTSPEPSVKS